MKITIYELLGLIKDGKAPKKIEYKNSVFEYRDNDYWSNDIGGWFSVECLMTDNLNDEIEILDEEDEIEIPQEFLKDVKPESEIVLIKDDIGHDYGYKNSVGFITDKCCFEGNYIFGFDKRENRWWECRFDKDEYIRTGLFVSDLFKPFVTLTPSKEDEFIDIEEITQECFDNWTCAKHINQLIKNQKKIIERLSNERD